MQVLENKLLCIGVLGTMISLGRAKGAEVGLVSFLTSKLSIQWYSAYIKIPIQSTTDILISYASQNFYF